MKTTGKIFTGLFAALFLFFVSYFWSGSVQMGTPLFYGLLAFLAVSVIVLICLAVKY